MKYLLLPLLILALLSGTASASTLTVSWSNPTTNEDGSVIPADGDGSLTEALVEYGSCTPDGGVETPLSSQWVSMPVTSYSFPNVSPGIYCAHVAVRNTYMNQSAWSASAQAEILPPPTPNPPEPVTLTVSP